MNYATRKLAAGYRSAKPSLTEQSGARETDINVIISRFAVSGTVPSSRTPPMSGDFSELPADLRGIIDMGKRLNALRDRLPPQLRSMSNEQLCTLTMEQLNTILTPPATPPAQEPTP